SRATSLSGCIGLPGDKSISPRFAMLAAVAEGPRRIQNSSTGAACHSTLSAVRSLGVNIDERDSNVVIYGRGLDGLQEPEQTLDAGNSGSTIRMLSGILAGQQFRTRIAGDASLSSRPMDRIIAP